MNVTRIVIFHILTGIHVKFSTVRNSSGLFHWLLVVVFDMLMKVKIMPEDDTCMLYWSNYYFSGIILVHFSKKATEWM